MILAISGKIGSGKDTVGNIIQYLIENTKRLKIDKISFDIFKLNREVGIANYNNSSEWQIKKFADKLKDIICLLINCTREQLEDQEFKNTELGEEWKQPKQYGCSNYSDDGGNCSYCSCLQKTLTPRLLLQLIGTECGRDIIHPNIWINSLMSEYNVLYYKQEDNNNKECEESSIPIYPNWIITDMRFPNELKAIKQKYGIVIRVEKVSNTKTWLDCFNCQGRSCPTCNGFGKILNLEHREHESETALDNAEFDYTIYNNGTIEELIEKVKQILIKENIILDEKV